MLSMLLFTEDSVTRNEYAFPPPQGSYSMVREMDTG